VNVDLDRYTEALKINSLTVVGNCDAFIELEYKDQTNKSVVVQSTRDRTQLLRQERVYVHENANVMIWISDNSIKIECHSGPCYESRSGESNDTMLPQRSTV